MCMHVNVAISFQIGIILGKNMQNIMEQARTHISKTKLNLTVHLKMFKYEYQFHIVYTKDL